jgi:hypothetical protein
VWALQAIAANNWARVVAQKHPEVKNIADMLQGGVKGPKGHKSWVFGLGWGTQFDKSTGVTRWASTRAGLQPDKVPAAISSFVQQLLSGSIDLVALRGPKGQALPDPSTWPKIRSFLQYKNFSQVVQAQQGDQAEHNPDDVVAAWGNPSLLADVDGVRFYA